MRDYIVLYRSFNADKPNDYEWFAEHEGHSDITTQHGDIGSAKTYVRVPNKSLLLEWFNRIEQPFSTDYVSIGGNHFGFDDAWGRIFGANIVGGFDSLEALGTSDAYGALYGRPARDSRGRFIGHF